MLQDFEQASEYVLEKNKGLYSRFSPDWASPPGDTISDLLEEKDWGIDQLADLLHLSVGDTNKLISGDIPITEEIAHKLEQVLGSSAKFWLNREYQYRKQLIKLKGKGQMSHSISESEVSLLISLRKEYDGFPIEVFEDELKDAKSLIEKGLLIEDKDSRNPTLMVYFPETDSEEGMVTITREEFDFLTASVL